MPKSIPPVDPDLKPNTGDQRREELEFKLLEADAEFLKLSTREAGQRYWLRWIAVGTGVLVVVAMALLLAHLAHHMLTWKILFTGQAFAVAMIVAPITSITAITVALFVGAFRKFDEKDFENIGAGTISGGVKMISGN